MRTVPIHTRFTIFFAGCALITLVGSCSLSKKNPSADPAKVMETESMLVEAGFRRVPIETPEQSGAVKQLPVYQLNRYQAEHGNVYWYTDPDTCSCLYEGDQSAYDQYALLLQQQQETAEYINDVNREQLAYMSPFGYAFPPPLLLGAWPVLISGGAPVAPGPPAGHGPWGSPGHGHGGAIGHGGGGHGR